MLIRKMQEPLAAISKETRRAEESLFLRLEELAHDKPFLLDCSVQQLADDEFVAVLSDHDSGAELCAWSGAADGVVVEFGAWLEKKYPHSVHRLNHPCEEFRERCERFDTDLFPLSR